MTSHIPVPSNITSSKSGDAKPIYAISLDEWDNWQQTQSDHAKAWIAHRQKGIAANAGEIIIVPQSDGTGIERIAVLYEGKSPSIWTLSRAANHLPSGEYALTGANSSETEYKLALGWALASYQFDRFKSEAVKSERLAKLIISSDTLKRALPAAGAIMLTRDLVNMPPNDLTPYKFADIASDIAKELNMQVTVLRDEELLEQNYPTVHAVGRASANRPALADLRWGKKSDPKLTLVGKGVTFDSGGLNLKSGSSMGLMKKDMGGAAHALALATLIVKHKLPVNLRVLLPFVENAVSSEAFRPQDVLVTRSGVTVEIGNTDAEGRLILSDALVEADSESPDLLIDMATLTGASRIALGTEIPSFFTPADALANSLQSYVSAQEDMLWRLPLWDEYESLISSDVADVNNSGSSRYAGAITAALFLRKFVPNTSNWIHVDMMAWNVSSKAGRPKGGEAQGLRSLFAMLQDKYKS